MSTKTCTLFDHEPSVELSILNLPPVVHCLSLWQPWASFVAYLLKSNETRGWATNYRGPLAIHATKKEPSEVFSELFELSFVEDERLAREYVCGLMEISGLADREPRAGECRELFNALPRGKILCVVNLVDCVPTRSVKDDITYQEWAYGDYSDGRFAWVTEMVHRFEEPIPAKGSQGLWQWERPV